MYMGFRITFFAYDKLNVFILQIKQELKFYRNNTIILKLF